MNDADTAGLTLLVSQAGAQQSWMFRPEPLRPFISRVLLVTGHPGDHLARLMDKGFPGVEIEHLLVDEGESSAARTERLHRWTGNTGDWILLLNTGCNASVWPQFRPPEKPVPQNVLHCSEDGGRAAWKTALIPADPACLSVGPSGEVAVEVEFSDAQCNDYIVIHAPGLFDFSRKSLASRLEIALNAHRRHGDSPAIGLEIAECCFNLQRYTEAGLWYRRCLDGNAGEEQWIARYRIARCLELTGEPWSKVEAALADAFNTAPDRAEPLYRLARHYFEAGDYRKAFDLAEVALPIDKPVTRHPFELSIYTHELALLYTACAVRLNRDRECIQVANETIRRPDIPEAARVEAAGHRTQSLERLQPVRSASTPRRNRLVVICPFRNAGEYLEQCAESLAAQDYEHCRFLLVDDASTDGALNDVDTRDPRFTVIRNDLRVGGLANQVKALEEHCEPDDIAVYVDGDDRLLGTDALRYINDFFNATGCWVMYGQYTDSHGRYGRCEPIAGEHEHVLDAIRGMYFPMHVRAHRAGLFNRLREIDPALHRLRDDDSEFLELINDMTLMRAMMQLAGLNNIRYNDRIIYEYNTRNPSSHFRKQKVLQDRQSRVLNTRPPLEPAASYLS